MLTVIKPPTMPLRLNLSRRPSLLDPYTFGDAWIKRCETDECMVLYVQGQPIAMIAAMQFDCFSLYQRVYELRRRAGCR